MIRDRGTIKWTSMMLPEHVKILRDWKVSQNYEQPKDVDEQLLEEMNRQLQQAIHEDASVQITYYKDHYHHNVKGKIGKINLHQNRLSIYEEQAGYMELYLSDIVDVKIES
ncbi:YolD-like family protein [Gottfriedia sp. NPDC056225]|uniref:YolD-like family protein n=1 Tax=Gottfriedia sp. NPDC056225 TaxID=3345751 RepID=UPI0015591AB0|nr:YolD-like family protein [Arthrobacter citreus]